MITYKRNKSRYKESTQSNIESFTRTAKQDLKRERKTDNIKE